MRGRQALGLGVGVGAEGSLMLCLSTAGKEKLKNCCVLPRTALIMPALRGGTRVLGSRLVLNNVMRNGST